jgi:hypothetical protein
MKAFWIALLFTGSLWGQVYSATVTAGGTGYTSSPTVTASGGGCSSEPTFLATITSGAVTAVVPNFMGLGCTSAPPLAFSGGGGSGAAATANLIPATIFVLEAVPSSSGSSVQPNIGGTNIAWHYACELTVPKARVPFFASTTLGGFRMPGTSQGTAVITTLVNGMSGAIASAYAAAWTNGILTEFTDYYIANSTVSAANIEAAIVAACTGQQTNLTNWNPWAAYGTFYNNGTWTIQGYQ